MKIFTRIADVSDADALQDDLSQLTSYCDTNLLDLNPLKCSVVTFSRKLPTNTLHYDYKIGAQTLTRGSSIRDLGVTHDSKLLFDDHVENIVSRAYRSLGFLMRITKDFTKAKTLKVLYCSLVRSMKYTRICVPDLESQIRSV